MFRSVSQIILQVVRLLGHNWVPEAPDNSPSRPSQLTNLVKDSKREEGAGGAGEEMQMAQWFAGAPKKALFGGIHLGGGGQKSI